ncbi:MAG: pyridoxamine 5'-phosphate oxidase [Phycisphaerales bacterium]|nr:pyridoxamine 5'-phosphate oxidase [Phycisphaerales bacterium]
MSLLNMLSPLIGAPILPDPLPADPVPLLRSWLAEAHAAKREPDPNACVLATADRRGRPSSRVVLCKAIEEPSGAVVFFTNYESRKGRELDANPYAAVAFHWAFAGRQARVEGPVERCTAEESDSYFASRAILSRIGAWASQQDRPLERRRDLVARVAEIAEAHHVPITQLMKDGGHADIPRPPHWGGFRLWPERIELWVAGKWRLHDRAAWTRSVELLGADEPAIGPWAGTRLQP